MRYVIEVIASLALAVGCVVAPAIGGAKSVPEGIQVYEDTVERIDLESGWQRWEIEHPSVWRTLSREKLDREITDPVMVDGALYYGVWNWLLRVDPNEGVIEKRRMFPAPIVGVERVSTDSGSVRMEVTVRVEHPEGEGTSTSVITHRPGEPSPQEVWNLVGIMSVWKDALYVSKAAATTYVGGESEEPLEFTVEERKRALAELREHRRQEPGNPYYDYYIGAIHQELGNASKAERAYRRAVETDGGNWLAFLQLTAFLDGARQHDFADRAYERFREKAENQPGVFVSRWTSLVGYMMTLGWSRHVVKDAVDQQAFERVDRVLERAAKTYPHLEYGPESWKKVASWFQTNGQTELAREWRGRASEAAATPWRQFRQSYETVDLLVATILGFTLAFWISCFVIGLRRSTPGAWMPRPTRGEWIGLGGMVLIVIGMLWVQGTAVQKVFMVAEGPSEVGISGWSSPNVRTWVSDLHSSEARDRLLDHVETQAAATREGRIEAVEPPDIETIVAAIDAHTRAEAWHRLIWEGRTKLMKQFDAPDLPVSLAIWLAVGCVAFLIGRLIGQFAILRTVGRFIVPAGARRASLLTPIVLGLFVTAVASLAFGADSLIQRIAEPSIGTYFGLDSVERGGASSTSPTRWWIVIGGVIAFHVATLWWDYRGARAVSDDRV